MYVLDISIDKIKEYDNNPRKNDAAVEKVASSIKKFGWQQPIVIDRNNIIVCGHTRFKAAKKLGIKTIPVKYADELTDDEIKAYRLADNKTAEFAEWDFDLLSEELKGINDIDMEQFGFDDQGIDNQQKHFWGDIKGAETQEYNDFVDKFKLKLTTDDCYTPEPVYEAAKDWAVKEYGLEGARIIRPFYPGGDYQSEDYSGDCAVIDNPPFSILSEIARYYMERNIRFFLFAPMLTLFSTASGECNYVVTDSHITYENGACVATSFITNMGEYKILTAPELVQSIEAACNKDTVELPRYLYPANVLTAAQLSSYCKLGRIAIKKAVFIRGLDSQKEAGKAIFGSGFLISDAAAEKAAAEKAAAEKAAQYWELSNREKEIIKKLNKDESAR